MFIRIAHRQNGRTTIQGGPNDAYYFTHGHRFDVTYLEDEKALILSKDPKGQYSATEVGAYRTEGACANIVAEVLPEWLPAFCVNEAEFEEVGEMLVWRRPPVWALAFPQHAPRSSDAARIAAISGMSLRIASAARNLIDPASVTQTAPAWVRSSMTAHDWQVVVSEFFSMSRV